MRLQAQLIVIPCITFAARARLASTAGTLSPIEIVALRAIGLGLDDIGSFAEVVGLGTRPALDLIYDFWLKGYVVIASGQGRVRLAGDAAKAFEEGKLAELGTAENNVAVIPLMQELVSGAILPHVGRPYPSGPESAMVPAPRASLDLTGVTRTELLDAVQREVRRQSQKQGRPLVVQEAWTEPDQLLGNGSLATDGHQQQRRFLSMWADIERDSDSGRLVFNVVEAPEVDQPLRQRLARSLSLLNERTQESFFFKRLRQEFDRGAVGSGPEDSEGPIERLLRASSDLEGTDRGVLEQRQLELGKLRDEACRDVQEAMRSESRVQVVGGYAEHEKEIRRLVDQANRQLVIGNPWLKMEAIVTPPSASDASWYDLLHRALSRGVQIFLLWGIGPDETLDPSMANALAKLTSENGGRLIFSRRSSNLHAKFVLRDGHEALVTSFNFLHPPPEPRRGFELGLLVSGLHPEAAPEAVLDLLMWSRGWFPDYQAAQRMLLLPSELGAKEPDLPSLPPSPELPSTEATVPVRGEQSPAIRHWAASWAAVSRQLAELRRVHGRTVRLIVDREHRDELWRALRASRARIAALSDRVSVDVVNDRFVRALRTRLDAGVACTFLFRREGATDQDEGPAERLRLEAHRVPRLCRLVAAESHAKALVCDDEVVVGSFNFLSYGGDYAQGRRERAELSLHVRDRDVTNRVLELLEAHWPDQFAGLIGRTPTDPSPIAVRLPPKLQQLFRAVWQQPRGCGQAFLDWFQAAPAPWEDLETLQRAGLQGDDLEQAAAAAVACASPSSDEAHRWRAWLAMACWRRQDFTGCALLLPVEAQADCGVPEWLAALGAAVGSDPGRLATAFPATSGLSRGEAMAALAFLMVAILIHGRFELLGMLDGLGEKIGGQMAAWCRAARSYVEATFQPLPLSLLRRTLVNQEQVLEREMARESLREALAHAETIGFRFQVGDHTWDLLKKEGNLLGELRRSCEDNDPIRLSRYFSTIDGAGRSVAKIMDDASWEVRDRHSSRIEGRKRVPCLTRLETATEAGREWVALSLTLAPDASEAKVLDACEPLRRVLGDLRADPGAPPDPIADPALDHARARLALLLRTTQ